MTGRLGIARVAAVSLVVVAVASAAFGQIGAAPPAAALAPHLTAGSLGAYTPPPCVGLFTDVPCSSQFAAWVEALYNDGITSGCGTGLYCPESGVTRRQMAVFLERVMRGSANWPAHTQLAFAVRSAAGAPDPAASGTALLAAIAAIPTSGGDAPSASNPWLVKVGPGIYDLGSGSLTIPAFTALEGAGEDVTVIVAAGSASQAGGTLVLNDHSQARGLTVKNTGGAAFANGIAVADGSTGVRLERVTVDASQPSYATANQTYGVTAGTGTQMIVSDVTVSAHGGYNNQGLRAGASAHTTTLDRITVIANGCHPSGVAVGLESAGAPVVITGSAISASSGTYATAVAVGQGVEWTMQSTRVSALDTSYPTGILVYADNTHIQDVHIITHGQGVVLSSCGGAACDAEIVSTRIVAGSWAIDNNTGFTTLVGGSRLVGNTVNTGGTLHCMANYTTTSFYPSTCP